MDRRADIVAVDYARRAETTGRLSRMAALAIPMGVACCPFLPFWLASEWLHSVVDRAGVPREPATLAIAYVWVGSGVAFAGLALMRIRRSEGRLWGRGPAWAGLFLAGLWLLLLVGINLIDLASPRRPMGP